LRKPQRRVIGVLGKGALTPDGFRQEREYENGDMRKKNRGGHRRVHRRGMSEHFKVLGDADISHKLKRSGNKDEHGLYTRQKRFPSDLQELLGERRGDEGRAKGGSSVERLAGANGTGVRGEGII